MLKGGRAFPSLGLLECMRTQPPMAVILEGEEKEKVVGEFGFSAADAGNGTCWLPSFQMRIKSALLKRHDVEMRNE